MNQKGFSVKKLVCLLFFLIILPLVLLMLSASDLLDKSPKQIYQLLSIQYEATSKDNTESIKDKSNNKEEQSMKYILQWTSSETVPFVYMGTGQNGFKERNCPYTNCFVTNNRELFNDTTIFDVIMFHGPELAQSVSYKLPEKRSPHQKFVFASIESSDNYPICSDKYNGYFNWTWTYKLDSEVRWGYMSIWDENDNIVGPNKDMNWIEVKYMDPVNDYLKEELKSKTIAAAWFASNCYSVSKREQYVKDLMVELKKYNLKVDVFGRCGSKMCSKKHEEKCFKMVKDKYYFYLSFENSFSEDYVTEKLLTALQNDAVPIVYGGANYTRFMPPGIYLNARELGVKALAAKMDHLIKHPKVYAEYFKWKKYYEYRKLSNSVLTNEYCLFCTILNDEKRVKEKTVYQDFRSWWDPPGQC